MHITERAIEDNGMTSSIKIHVNRWNLEGTKCRLESRCQQAKAIEQG
jgi:hypothetical protein